MIEVIKAWYNPEVKGYSFFLENGEEVKPICRSDIKINDNWGVAKLPTATIEFPCEIVNEKPIIYANSK